MFFQVSENKYINLNAVSEVVFNPGRMSFFYKNQRLNPEHIHGDNAQLAWKKFTTRRSAQTWKEEEVGDG